MRHRPNNPKSDAIAFVLVIMMVVFAWFYIALLVRTARMPNATLGEIVTNREHR